MRLITTWVEQQVLLLNALDSRNSTNLFPGIEKKIQVLSLVKLINIPGVSTNTQNNHKHLDVYKQFLYSKVFYILMK